MGVSVAIGVGIGAVVGGGVAAIQSGGDFNAIWKGALIGGVGGAVGGWAAPALSSAMGTFGGAIGASGVSLGGAMAGGALGGATSGLLGAALNGGNGDSYWKGALFGGLGGAAAGGLTYGAGQLFGGAEAGINPVTGEAVPVGTPEITPLSDAGAPATSLSSPVASGVGGSNIDAAPTINASVTGAPAAPEYAPFGGDININTPTPSVPTGATPVNTLEYAAFGGDSATPKATEFAPFGGDGTNATAGTGGENSPAYWEKYLPSGAPKEPTTFDNLKGWLSQKAAGYPSTSGTGKDMLGKVLMGNMMGNALKGGGAIMGMNEARQNQNQLMDLYNQQNQQYQTQNAAANAYQNQLGETYSNPDEYLNSPEALASRQLAMQKLLAQNAQAGRRTAGLPMQNQLMMNQLQNLAAYRQGLRSAATGAYASPTGLGSTLQAAQAQSPTGNLMAGLGSIFAPAAAYYLM